jgi:hypothetical protein
MLNYKFVILQGRTTVENPVEMPLDTGSNTPKISLYSKLHRFRSSEVLLKKQSQKLLKTPYFLKEMHSLLPPRQC